MKKSISRIALAAMCLWMLRSGVFAEELLIPGGQVVGLQLCNNTVTVAAFDDGLGGDSKAAGLQVGDEILRIDGARVYITNDISLLLSRYGGEKHDILVRRDGEKVLITDAELKVTEYTYGGQKF